MPLIETRDLWKTYTMGDEEVHALRGVSVDIERGEYVAIIPHCICINTRTWYYSFSH
jgi:ABC-type glutathione transport system ATPase component